MLIWSAAALILLVIVLSVQLWRSLGRRAIVFVLLLAGASSLGWWCLLVATRAPGRAQQDRLTSAPALAEVEYTTSTSCRKCHADHYESWYTTYHRTMTREATPEYVKGDFSGEEIEVAGLPVRFSRDGDQFLMETVHPEWAEKAGASGAQASSRDAQPPPRVVFPVDRVIGSHIAQAYLTRGPLDHPGRASGVYLVLPYHYSLLDRRWITRIGSFLQPPPGELFAQTHVWNDVCIFCHNVKPRPRKVLTESDRYFSAPAELGIACESCHGPGQLHAAAHRDPLRRFARDGKGHDPTIVNPEKLDAVAASAVCGRCHGKAGPKDEATNRRIQLAGEDPYTPGDRLDKWFDLPMPDNDFPAGSPRGNLFWPDGTPLAAGLEYQGLLLSPCYQHGAGERQMTCLSCHSLHQSEPVDQLEAGMRTNQACYGCHEEKRDALVEHTHHQAGSPGSLCYNCHSPNVVYGLLGVHRSHRVISPSVRAMRDTGLPNACNLCHLDQTLAWTSEQMARWYGHDDLGPELDSDNRSIAASLVLLLRGDAVQRAVAANAFWRAASDEVEPGFSVPETHPAQRPTTARPSTSQSPDTAPHGPEHLQWSVPFLVELLDDPYAAVRLQAHRALRAITGRDDDYFYLDPAAKRRAASTAVLNSWLSDFTQPAEQRIPSAVPLDPDGVPDRTTLQRLHDARDNREVAIDE